jgi:serine O-acetyltransferase
MGFTDTLKRNVAEARARRRQGRELAARNPGFAEAVAADVAVTCKFRGERWELTDKWDVLFNGVRLALNSDAFAAQLCYRGKVALRRRGVPVLPAVAHRLSMALSDVCIGDPVVLAPGVYIPHGQVVVDGLTEVGSDVILFPWITIGLRAGNFNGPHVGDGVHVGTGSRVLGQVQVGDGASIGANAVVIDDVPAGASMVGVPATPVVKRQTTAARS